MSTGGLFFIIVFLAPLGCAEIGYECFGWFGAVFFFLLSIWPLVYFWRSTNEFIDYLKRGVTSVPDDCGILLICMAAILAKLARADGNITKEEILFSDRFFESIVQFNYKIDFCRQAFRNAKSDNYSVYDYADACYSCCSNRSVLEDFYRTLWLLSVSDGEITEEERSILEKIVVFLKLDRRIYENYYAKFVSGKSKRNFNGRSEEDISDEEFLKACMVLECSPSSSDSEFKAAYRNKAMKWHPDHIKGNYNSEYANGMMSKINNAWEVIKRKRKFS